MKGFFEINEDMVEILLMLGVLFTQDSKAEDLLSGVPSALSPACSSVGWLVVLGLTALSDNISVYIGPSHKEREKEEKGQMRVKMSEPPPRGPTASAIGLYPTVIKIVGRLGTGSVGWLFWV